MKDHCKRHCVFQMLQESESYFPATINCSDTKRPSHAISKEDRSFRNLRYNNYYGTGPVKWDKNKCRKMMFHIYVGFIQAIEHG